jgi:signal transduction histidine kinase
MPSRIAVVTSDAATVRRLADLLAERDCEVVHAGDGSRDVPAHPRPDLVVVDTRLAGADAAAIVARVARFAAPRPAILVLADREAAEDAIAAVQRGADDVLFRPPCPLGFPARVSALLDRQRLSEAKERNQTLEFRVQELESFIYILTHDMKTPVVNLLGLCGLLVQDHGKALPQAAHDLLERARRNAERIEELLRDLLEYPRRLSILGPLEPADSGRVAASAVDGLRELARSHGVEVSVAADLPTVSCDAKRLQQVFHNLVENGIKHARTVEHPRVEVAWTRTAEGPRFEVRDNGPGIEAEHLRDIFKLFHRAPGGSPDGTGIGLAVARQLVEAHGGTIWCESRLGRGTTFAFTLSHDPPLVVR